MVTITQELNLLEIEDLESALSKHYGKEIKLSDVNCTLVHCIPMDTGHPSGQYLEITVEGEEDETDSLDLFFDYDLHGHFLDGKELSLDEEWAIEVEIFAFSVSEFHSYDSYVDSSD